MLSTLLFGTNTSRTRFGWLAVPTSGATDALSDGVRHLVHFVLLCFRQQAGTCSERSHALLHRRAVFPYLFQPSEVAPIRGPHTGASTVTPQSSGPNREKQEHTETTRQRAMWMTRQTLSLEPRIHACVIRPKKQEGLKDTFKSVEHDMKPNSI